MGEKNKVRHKRKYAKKNKANHFQDLHFLLPSYSLHEFHKHPSPIAQNDEKSPYFAVGAQVGGVIRQTSHLSSRQCAVSISNSSAFVN